MSPSSTSVENKTPREIGREMIRLRTQFNLTPQEVAERIHIRPRYITAMEEARYDQMPGKVYARGYIQTYAEFLGMNPEKTVQQCFAGDVAPNAQPVPPPAATLATLRTGSLPYKRMAIGVAALVLVVMVISALTGDGDAPSEEPVLTSVAPVPESMLASIRTLVMPTADNYECLMIESPLSCFYSDAVSHLLSQLTSSTRLPFGGDIDVSAFIASPKTVDESFPSDMTSGPVTGDASASDESEND